MKLNDIKHNHSLTDLLKVLIFSLLMIAPLLASVSQMLYATFNKNAYQSYSGYNLQSNTELATDIQSGLNYQLNVSSYTGNFYTNTQIEVENLVVEVDNSTYQTWFNNNVSDIKYISFTLSQTNQTRTYYYNDNAERLEFFSLNYAFLNISFKARSNTTLNNNDILYRVYQQQVGNSLDNAFYYGVEQMTESNLFNWTQNTAIYNGINTMTSQLGIQTNAIPILLTYWFLLTIIYVIIDIILKAFTTITHMLQKK